MLSVTYKFFMLNVVMLSVIIPSVTYKLFMLNVVMLSVIIPSVMAPSKYIRVNSFNSIKAHLHVRLASQTLHCVFVFISLALTT